MLAADSRRCRADDRGQDDRALGCDSDQSKSLTLLAPATRRTGNRLGGASRYLADSGEQPERVYGHGMMALKELQLQAQPIDCIGNVVPSWG